ncbi:LPXTG cell wall anchor domain-containing protein [Levilactobacillus spicheri]
MTATTLPQTGERAAIVNPLAAGLLLLLTTLGLAGRRKHRNG